MSNIQKEIENAEQSAVKDLEATVSYLSEKFKEAGKKAREIVKNAHKEADTVFLSKKAQLDEKILKAFSDSDAELEKKQKSLIKEKTVLLDKGVSFLLTRLTK